MAIKKLGSIRSVDKKWKHQWKQATRLHRWYDKLRRSRQDDDLVPTILKRLASENEGSRRDTLKAILRLEYMHQGRDADLRAALRSEIDEEPHVAYPRIRLAEQYLYHDNLAPKALEIIEEAIGLAKSSGCYFFYASGVKARCLRKVGLITQLESLLVEMMKWDPNDTIVDIPPETDFLEKIPHGAIEKDLIESYVDFSRYVRRVWDKKFPVS